jgi:glutamate racemase
MSIGVFDSGMGGLSVHRALVEAMPEADFIYLGDHAHSPYGGRSGEEIVDLTRAACERLFAEGVDLVVLACNTASAIALRRLQQTWLPGYRKTLGRPLNVLRPGLGLRAGAARREGGGGGGDRRLLHRRHRALAGL